MPLSGVDFRTVHLWCGMPQNTIPVCSGQTQNVLHKSFGDADGERQIPDADGAFSNAPIFNFNDERLKFDTNFASNANPNYGSASGFLLQSLLLQEMPLSRGISHASQRRRSFFVFTRTCMDDRARDSLRI